MNDLKAKREALDMAIADIKSAIQRSKQVALQSPYDNHQSDQNEPVWIRRYHIPFPFNSKYILHISVSWLFATSILICE